MRCPQCTNLDSKVIDSRSSDDGESIRRRRECTSCGFRFTTYERAGDLPLVVIKKDGMAEPFDREKLLRGLITATVKRDIPLSRLDGLVNDVETELRNTFRNEVPSKQLGDMVLLRLFTLDKVAYIRFASVYKDFKDLDEFTSELGSVRSRG
jgi:transcriptional repressor NrdR